MSEVLRTERLVLIPATPEQIRALIADDYARAASLLGCDVPLGWPTDRDAREGLSWHLAAIDDDPAQRLWRIRFVIESGALIGSINLKGPPSLDGDVEIGWGIVPAARRRGFATEATRAVIAWALASARVRRVSATIPEDNEPSQAVGRRLGMRPTGETRRGLPLWALER